MHRLAEREGEERMERGRSGLRDGTDPGTFLARVSLI
jgi:hypothetical protein